MKLSQGKTSVNSASECLVIPFFKGERGAVCAVKKSVPQCVDFFGNASETCFIYPQNSLEKSNDKGFRAKRVLLLGLGEKKHFSLEILRLAYGMAVQACIKKKLKTLSLFLPETLEIKGTPKSEIFTAALEGLLFGNYSFEKLKGDSEKSYPLEEAEIFWPNSKDFEKIEKIKAISVGVHLARDMTNNNADIETPHRLAEAAKSLTKLSSKLKVEVFGRDRIAKEKMGLLLAVSQGAAVEPKLITLEYKGNPSSKDLTVLVGKGITFDTGGLDLKTADGMETMKSDMAGAAAVLGVFHVLCFLGLKLNVTGVIPATENAIGSKSYKPGDVYRSYLGKTVEIQNTDAEGRLILADALSYSVKNFKPDRIVDIATLTGAIVVALGEEITGCFSNDDQVAFLLEKAAKKTGEHLWRMPLYGDYIKLLKSDIADIKNCGSRKGSSITASLFLEQFVEKTKWAHLDIGGASWYSEAKGYYTKYATGSGVRLLLEFCERAAKS